MIRQAEATLVFVPICPDDAQYLCRECMSKQVVPRTILETPRLILRQFVPEDAEALARVLSDPETMRHYPAPLDRAGVERWIARNLERYKADGVGLWAIVLKWTDAQTRVSAPDKSSLSRVGMRAPHQPSTPHEQSSEQHEPIGDCGIVRQELEGEMFYEIGYHLRRDQWRKGYATEAARACRNWAFEYLRAERVISLIRPENVRSRHVAERAGLTLWKEVEWYGLRHSVFMVRRNEILPYQDRAS